MNSTVKVILTVSPVRHINDTLELNSVSKSILRASCHTIVEEHPDITYFPAYEIMMDDLRDYRFYKADMIHPSTVAENYIWDKFSDTYFNPALKEFVQAWEQIQNRLDHKPFHPASKAHQAFLRELITKLETFRGIVNVEDEIARVRTQLLSSTAE